MENIYSLTDEEIAVRVQKGDTQAFGVLVERYEEKLKRYGRKFLSSIEDREDLVQDIFIRAYQNLQSFDGAMQFSSWVYRIAHNIFVDALRKLSRRPLIFVDFDTFLYHPVYEDEEHPASDRVMVREMLEKGLSQVNQKYREVLILYYYEEIPYKEIAEILSIPISTVSIRLKRGREALQKILEKIQ
jgi:RNA polymerase sigma-70 factor (ECF subfamily)